MKVTYTWLIYSCLFFGSSILCDSKLKRRQAASSCSVDAEDKFDCSDGMCIEWSWVCDGRKDCSDGSDEAKELCGQYQYGTSCGRVYINNDEMIVDGEISLNGSLPWQVGLFILKQDNSSYVLTCAGSIIAPNLIITAAQCLMKISSSDRPSIIDRFAIVVSGDYKRDIETFYNDFAEITEVKTFYIQKGYFDMYGTSGDDIAIVVLGQELSFNNFVQPICVDWNGIYNVKNGDQGKVVLESWKNGSTTSFLVESSLPYVDLSTCHRTNIEEFTQFLTFDKFCTNRKIGKKVRGVSGGSGIGFLHNNSYYLTGILSNTNYLQNDTVLSFTDMKYHVEWMRVSLSKHFTEYSCILPAIEGVVYSYAGSKKRLSHGSLIKQQLTVIENCEVGYHKAYDGFRICLGQGKWSSNLEKLCYKMCPPLESDSLNIKCSHNGKFANCSNLSIPDTIATPSCKPTYTAPNGQDVTPFELVCQSNGTWNNQLYRCSPYCGRVYISKQELIRNGEKARVGTVPWNVGIYQLNKTNSNYDLICGGSIISPNLVVSGAHCFWKKGMLSKRISINDGLYKIAVGKYDRNFTIIDNDFTQIKNVEMIHLKDDYYGPTGYHAEDIAIIVLQNRVSFSEGVAPVCIDWKDKYNIVNGDQGKIVGWGTTENGILSSILLEASLPYIDHSSCRNMYTNGFESFVTIDKFCAGSASVSGQGVGKGYSGSGLSFLHSDSYYLTGIVSIKDPNRNNSIAVFTEIKYHLQWIRRLYNKYN